MKVLDIKDSLGNTEYSLNSIEAIQLVIDLLMEHNTARDNKLDKTLLYLIHKAEKTPRYVTAREFKLLLKQLREINNIMEKIIKEVVFIRDNLSSVDDL